MFTGIGTVANVVAVLVGSIAGMIFRSGLKERFQNILIQSLGLSTMFLGAAGAMKGMLFITPEGIDTGGTWMLIGSLVIGSIIGEAINIEYWLERFGEWLKSTVKSKNDPRFVEGFVNSSLTICIGGMAIVGAIQDALLHDPSVLFTKAILDLAIVMVFASTYGKGVAFSAIPLGIWQGLITVFAGLLAPLLPEYAVSQISYVGSVLIFCVGVNIVFGKKFKVGNMLPSLILAAVLSFVL